MKGPRASPAMIAVAVVVLLLILGGLWWLNFGRGSTTGGSATGTTAPPRIGAPGVPPLPGGPPPSDSR
ncbi:MAG: hypothetical protein NZT92_04815 [Abditibacteriales bacterium]|nr:hypothetical protein [Abditibacteriales bacterium]MDW8365256.1 hypothetical protein [Abditibacteriales bacterium]